MRWRAKNLIYRVSVCSTSPLFLWFSTFFLSPFELQPIQLCTILESHTHTQAHTSNVLLHWGFMSYSSHPRLPQFFHTQEREDSEGAAPVVDILHWRSEMLKNKVPSLTAWVSPTPSGLSCDLIQYLSMLYCFHVILYRLINLFRHVKLNKSSVQCSEFHSFFAPCIGNVSVHESMTEFQRMHCSF